MAELVELFQELHAAFAFHCLEILPINGKICAMETVAPDRMAVCIADFGAAIDERHVRKEQIHDEHSVHCLRTDALFEAVFVVVVDCVVIFEQENRLEAALKVLFAEIEHDVADM